MVSDLIFIDILPIYIVLSLERTQKLLCLLVYEIVFRYFELSIVGFHNSLLMLTDRAKSCHQHIGRPPYVPPLIASFGKKSENCYKWKIG